eukprot:164679-Rhodomonas_salina.1
MQCRWTSADCDLVQSEFPRALGLAEAVAEDVVGGRVADPRLQNLSPTRVLSAGPGFMFLRTPT